MAGGRQPNPRLVALRTRLREEVDERHRTIPQALFGNYDILGMVSAHLSADKAIRRAFIRFCHDQVRHFRLPGGARELVYQQELFPDEEDGDILRVEHHYLAADKVLADPQRRVLAAYRAFDHASDTIKGCPCIPAHVAEKALRALNEARRDVG